MRHLTTLAALISGIVGSHSTHLPKMATQVPNGTKPESRVKRFVRWVGNTTITECGLSHIMGSYPLLVI